MSLTADDFAKFLGTEERGDGSPLGDALDELAINIDVDSVAAVRELRENV